MLNDLTKQLWGQTPLFFKVLFIAQFVVYAAIIYAAIHFISKLW